MHKKKTILDEEAHSQEARWKMNSKRNEISLAETICRYPKINK